MPPTLQMLGIPFKVNTVLNYVFNMFSVMGCLIIGVYALVWGHMACELFITPPVSVADIANQS